MMRTKGTYSLLFLLSLTYVAFGDEPVIVQTQYGSILGYQTDQARFFYGIPFARPPVNDLRWQAPVPIDPWAPKTINATSPAPACPQPKCHLPHILCPTIFSEDCLYLNVMTPRNLTTQLLPVLIFITGGNFQFLDASLPVYYPERLVNTTNIIVAFIQYRLGVLGFLATGTGSDDLKGNYGILDQRLSIAWIKENIQAFGGDPAQITISGQSAGGQSAALHYVTPEMQSLFRAAIVESAPTSLAFRTYEEYITPGVLLGEQLGCQYRDHACYRRATYDQIIAAQLVVNGYFTSFNFLVFFEPWVPVIDNHIVYDQVINTIKNVSFPLKPLMIGTVTEDGLEFIYQGWKNPVTPQQFIEAAIASFGTKALKVIEHFPPIDPGDQRPLLTRIATAWVFYCSNRIIARHSNPYTYVFGYPLDFDGWENMTYCNGHVCHGGDLPYQFESYWRNFTDAGRQLSQSMATYWTNFVKTSDPNSPVKLAIEWPKMSPGNEPYIYFQNPMEIRKSYLNDDCDFFDQIGYKMNQSFRF